MKDKLIEENLSMCYRNHLISKLEKEFTSNVRTQCSKNEDMDTLSTNIPRSSVPIVANFGNYDYKHL